jgi:hypothetical protein
MHNPPPVEGPLVSTPGNWHREVVVRLTREMRPLTHDPETSERVADALRVIYGALPPGGTILAQALRMPASMLANQSGQQEKPTLDGELIVSKIGGRAAVGFPLETTT